MLREIFIGRNPSHFKVNSIVKAFIISEIFFWASWNFILPIYAIYTVTKVADGSIEIAGSAFSIYLIGRVIFELVSGRYLLKASELEKFIIIIIGILITSVSFFGLISSTTIPILFFFFGLIGTGFGIASPAKYSLFSTHLDKNKEPIEWGLYDATTFAAMAGSAALGGFIASKYGFGILFTIAAIMNVLSIIPYLLHITSSKKS